MSEQGPCDSIIEKAEKEMAALVVARDSAYHQRNMLVGLLSKLYPSWINLDPGEPDWPVVLIQLPTGQVSWHITYQERYSIFAHIYGESGPPWDGHDDVEKWRRVSAMLGPIAGSVKP